MALVRSILFIDGENLAFRFQALADQGRQARASVVHSKDVFVWNSEVAHNGIPGVNTDVLRVAYYTSVVGDDVRLAEMRNIIAANQYGVHNAGMMDYYGPCQLTPRIFKKAAQSHKSRLVDIAIAIDVMRHACTRAIDVIYLFSGDGDFLELVSEVARQGQKVCVGAFSSGLEPRVPSTVDRFILLDELFFLPRLPTPESPAQLGLAETTG
jgi:uncharacterized LabA/DUF88 family protein